MSDSDDGPRGCGQTPAWSLDEDDQYPQHRYTSAAATIGPGLRQP